MVNDPRLGRITPEQVTFPALSVSGNPYERHQSTLQLGDGYFVVLDMWGAADEGVLDELRKRIAPKAKKGKHDDQAEAVATPDDQPDAGETGGTP